MSEWNRVDVYYFKGRGRAEIIRWTLAACDVGFSNIDLEGPEDIRQGHPAHELQHRANLVGAGAPGLLKYFAQNAVYHITGPEERKTRHHQLCNEHVR